MNTHRILATLFLLVGIAGLAPTAQASKTLSALPEGGIGVDDSATQRDTLIARIVDKWAAFAEETYQVSASQWRAEMDPLFAKASLAALQQAADAQTYDAMDRAILAGNGAIAPMALGDTAADLVYVPISPCRIFDTRVAGGIINAGSTRDFDVTAAVNYTSQGGSNTDCNGAGSAGEFAAAAIIFTTVNPANIGYITAYPLNTTRPTSATMAYNANTLASNQAIVKLDQTVATNELTVYTSAQTHLVGDIVGYFAQPRATALECSRQFGSFVSVPANTYGFGVSATCPTGYSATGLGIEAAANVVMADSAISSSGGTIFTYNLGGTAQSTRAWAQCCRVPGR